MKTPAYSRIIMVNGPLNRCTFMISHRTKKAQVRMEPGGRALDTSGMAETPPGSSYNGNGRGGFLQVRSGHFSAPAI